MNYKKYNLFFKTQIIAKFPVVLSPLIIFYFLLLISNIIYITYCDAVTDACPEPPAFEEIVNFPETWEKFQGIVVHVIDGDTVRLKDGTLIRLIGIDAPEMNGRKRGGEEGPEPGALEARKWLEKTLRGRSIVYYVSRDNSEDRYGRTPALIFFEGRCINLELLRLGHARVRYLKFVPDIKSELFYQAEKEGLKNMRHNYSR